MFRYSELCSRCEHVVIITVSSVSMETEMRSQILVKFPYIKSDLRFSQRRL
jgi:hypothetical protein